MPKDFNTFQKTTGLDFKDPALLRQAFVHRSYINEHREEVQVHNERLEFLGDAVLELASTQFLYERFPDKTEGDLTSYRAALVNAVTCAEIATNLGMNDYLLLSKGESKDTGRARGILLANAFEALIGALYVDQGYEAARDFIAKYLFPKIDDIITHKLWRDPKSTLQEKAQDAQGVTPSYSILKETGPDHDKEFVVGVYLGDTLAGQGEGKSKQDAEQAAARSALEAKGW